MTGLLETNLNGHAHALIPSGVADYFWDAAAKRRALENKLLAVFHSWGYGDIIPPTLEYTDTFDTGHRAGYGSTHGSGDTSDHSSGTRVGRMSSAGPDKSKMVRFVDHDGQSLALRYDMTMAIARLVGSRLHDAPMPQRFCYVGNIFRNREHQPGRLREFSQAGIELIGANTTAADAEVLALTAQALQTAGLTEFRLALGEMRFFRGLLEELVLSPEQQFLLTRAIERRSEPELSRFMDDASLSAQHKNAVERLLTLNGPHSMDTMAAAQAICLNKTMEDAVANLRAIHHALDAYNLSHFIHLDLTEVSDMGYYTGIRFTAYVPGLGRGIAGGGRYDNLIGSFGPPQPAVGVALGVERILVALQSISGAAQPLVEHHVLVSAELDSAWVQIVEEWRAVGIKAVVDVNGRRGAALWQAAQAKGIPCALTWTGHGFDIYNSSSEPHSPSQQISVEESTSYLAAALT